MLVKTSVSRLWPNTTNQLILRMSSYKILVLLCYDREQRLRAQENPSPSPAGLSLRP